MAADGTLVVEVDGRTRWWTFAGGNANRLLATALGEVAPEFMDDWVTTNYAVSLRADATAPAVATAMRAARRRFGDGLEDIDPEVSEQAVKELKFQEMLPPGWRWQRSLLGRQIMLGCGRYWPKGSRPGTSSTERNDSGRTSPQCGSRLR